MIKLVIFDLSGVCFNEEEEPYVRKFTSKRNLDFDSFYGEYLELLNKAEVGESTGEKVWEELAKKYNMEIDIPTILDDMMAGKVVYQEVLNFVLEVQKHCKTAYLTNYCKAYSDKFMQKFDMEKYFDFGIISWQIGFRKPAPEGFKKIMEHFKVKPEETVFLDDTEKNAKKAAELGIHAIHYQNLEQLMEELKKLSVSIN